MQIFLFSLSQRSPSDVFVRTGVDNEHEDEESNKQDGGMGVRCQEGCLEPTGRGVGNHTPWDEEGRKVEVHAGQCVHGGGATEQKHGCHDDVREQGKHEEHLVRGVSPTSLDDFLLLERRAGAPASNITEKKRKREGRSLLFPKWVYHTKCTFGTVARGTLQALRLRGDEVVYSSFSYD